MDASNPGASSSAWCSRGYFPGPFPRSPAPFKIMPKPARPLLLAVLLFFAGAVPAAAGLLINGNAENGTTSGWVTSGVELASTSLAGTVGLAPGVHIGQYSFHAGLGPANSQSLSQVVSLAPYATRIDAGEMQAVFRALLQSRRFGTTLDSVTGTLEFLTADGGVLVSVSFTDTSSPHHTYDWCAVHDIRVIPGGTRQISVRFDMSRSGGESTDCFVDNVSLGITPAGAVVPEPGCGQLCLGCVGALLVLQRLWRAGRG